MTLGQPFPSDRHSSKPSGTWGKYLLIFAQGLMTSIKMLTDVNVKWWKLEATKQC